MSCNPGLPPCRCNNPLAWGMLFYGRVNTNWCNCTNPPAVSDVVALYEGELRTNCQYICVERMRVYYNNNIITMPIAVNYVDCQTPEPIEVIPLEEEVIPCTLAPYNDLCYNTRIRARGFIFYDCLISIGLIFLNATEVQYGTDDLGLTSLLIRYDFIDPCTREETTACVFEVCFRNYTPAPFNTKEDYEVLKSLTLGTQVWESDMDITTLRRLRLIL